jgi:hypothetical protein
LVYPGAMEILWVEPFHISFERMFFFLHSTFCTTLQSFNLFTHTKVKNNNILIFVGNRWVGLVNLDQRGFEVNITLNRKREDSNTYIPT